MNGLKTTVLMVTLTLMLVAVGAVIGGKSEMTFALIMAFGMNFIAYWFSDKIVLRMYRARQVTEAEAPELYSMVAALSGRCHADAQGLYNRSGSSPMPSPRVGTLKTARSPLPQVS